MKQDHTPAENTTAVHFKRTKESSVCFPQAAEAEQQTDFIFQEAEDIADLSSIPAYHPLWFPRSVQQHIMLLIMLLGLISVCLLPLVLLPVPFRSQEREAAPEPSGLLSFLSSGQFNPGLTAGYNDTLVLAMPNLPPPPAGRIYGVWLMPDRTDNTAVPLLLGTLRQAGAVHLTYTAPNHANLLASYSGVRIVVQSAGAHPVTPDPNPRTWKWEGWIPDIPTPGDENGYSLLFHLRHLLALDPTLQQNHLPGGLDLWLTQNVSKVEEYASSAQGDWDGARTSASAAGQIHRQMLRILDYLDGVFYVWRDVPTGSPWLIDPLAGKIGLLESVPNQEPSGYLSHVDIHLMGLANSPGHTREQQQLALLIDQVINKMQQDLQRVRTDATQLAKRSVQQLRQLDNQAMLDEMVRLTIEAVSGWFDSQTGDDIGGVVWINARLQQLATIALHVSGTDN
jgi:hypothetical protein